MNILLVSQCSKRALTETRRIIDQFAERRGDRTWQTPITQIGLQTLRKLLRKNARRNTAVACHWIRSKNHTELLWIVGNASKFNQQGAVPTNITRRDVLRADDENGWATQEDMALLTAIAALFHDFGKANDMFQSKLKSKKPMCEPYRHEWVSLRMFAAFVDGRSDSDWLNALSNANETDDKKLLNKLLKDHPEQSVKNPFHPKSPQKLAPVARAVAWLILTHHKLPQYPYFGQNAPDLSYAEEFLDYELHPKWNSPQIANKNEYEESERQIRWTENDLEQVWTFSKTTPFASQSWCAKAKRVALRALRRKSFLNHHWLDDNYTMHLARLSLMMADHYYSSLSAQKAYQDKHYKAYANSHRLEGKTKAILNQKLDEHLIGVYRNGLQIVRLLPSLKSSLTQIARHSTLQKRSKLKAYQWQDKAMDIAKSVSDISEKQGFFGINMASTGKGKTFANCKIMYGLASSGTGCRFSIALGLRTLTLQTGQAVQQRLKLDDDEVAVLIGSQSVKQLHDLAQKQGLEQQIAQGSVSVNGWLDEDQQVIYEGSLNGPLKHWFEAKEKVNKLINAPILVSTIDHLMPATESDRGGKQIAPMLRLLTSDLVLDEIDDFDLQDLPAICRLVNWAGLMGSRVLLSSATLPPSLVNNLFAAYQAGRVQYNKVRGLQTGEQNEHKITCAWFDEFNASAASIANNEQLELHHQHFVSKRISKLNDEPAVRQAKIIPISLDDASEVELYNSQSENILRSVSAMANKFSESIYQLHQDHHQTNAQGQSLSIGLIRMANINPLVAVAKRLMNMPAKDDFHLHFCIYHSRHPLIVRSTIENMLDSCLKRGDVNAIWQQPSIVNGLQQSQAKHHVFVVISSPVAEVGRDHDYDWAIVEPSSMRSNIQLAGRVLRHRKKQIQAANIHILNRNFKALKGANQGVFSKPGFENDQGQLASTNLDELLIPEQYQKIDAQSRVQVPELTCDANQNLALFEHSQLDSKLTQGKLRANLWYQKPLSTNFELQRRTRFRQSAPTSDYVFWLEDDELTIRCWHKNGELKDHTYLFTIDSQANILATGVSLWGQFDLVQLIEQYSEAHELETEQASIKFAGISLIDSDNWHYDKVCGVYQTLNW